MSTPNRKREIIDFNRFKNKKNLLSKFKKLLEILEKEINQSDISNKIRDVLLLVNSEINKTPGFIREKSDLPLIIEVEDKYRVIDLDSFKKKVIEQNFTLEKEIIQEDIYCDIDQFLRKRDQNLRVRKIFNKNRKFIDGELKLEGSRGKIQDRPVYEIKVSSEKDLEELIKILKIIELDEFMHFKKQRFLYKRKESSGRTTEIELDSFEDPINSEKIKNKIYAQISQEVGPDKRDEALKEVKKIASIFNLKRDNRDYIEIASGYKNEG